MIKSSTLRTGYSGAADQEHIYCVSRLGSRSRDSDCVASRSHILRGRAALVSTSYLVAGRISPKAKLPAVRLDDRYLVH